MIATLLGILKVIGMIIGAIFIIFLAIVGGMFLWSWKDGFHY